jgi:hypothetical protein
MSGANIQISKSADKEPTAERQIQITGDLHGWDLAYSGWDLAYFGWDLAYCGWDLAYFGWDLAYCGWDLADEI